MGSMIDLKNAQIAKLELDVLKLSTAMNKMQSNEQLLRDENDDLKTQLQAIRSLKKNKLQFMDNKLLKRASIIHDSLKRRASHLIVSNEQEKKENDQMIDELTEQVESLENERS